MEYSMQMEALKAHIKMVKMDLLNLIVEEKKILKDKQQFKVFNKVQLLFNMKGFNLHYKFLAVLY